MSPSIFKKSYESLLSIAFKVKMFGRELSLDLRDMFFSHWTVYKRTYMATFVMALSILIENGWVFLKGDATIVNPFPLLRNYSVERQWYACNLSASIAWAVSSFTPLFYIRMNQVGKCASLIYIIYRLLDLTSFILASSTFSYALVLSVLAVCSVAVCYLEFRNKKQYRVIKKKIKIYGKVHQEDEHQ